ncbi:MAG: hypothetical protein ACK41E_11510 [Deinococcales bacterium]
MSAWQWVAVFFLGGLVAWLLQWVLDVLKWNSSQPAHGITNDDLREELIQKQREVLELRAKLEQH